MATFIAAPSAAAVSPGWAPGSFGTSAFEQYRTDNRVAATPSECGPNSMVLFWVRGSGEDFGSGRFRGWAAVTGRTLIRQGWRVRPLQGRYSAPEVPLTSALSQLGQFRPTRASRALKRYRDTAEREWVAVHADLVRALTLCPSRRAIVAGYSQGGLVLRYVIPRLPRGIRDRVLAVDLIADPTADARVDGRMGGRGVEGARRTDAGVDTAAARANPVFRQTPYPGDIARRTVQYCKSGDLVCDADVSPRVVWGTVLKVHTSYDWTRIGAATARRVGSAPSAGGAFPLVSCPMTSSPFPPGRGNPVPTSLPAPAGAPVGTGFYANGDIAVLAPAGWGCTSITGGNGSMKMLATPGTAVFESDGGSRPTTAVYAFVAFSPFTADQLACPYFPAARTRLGSCDDPPAGEQLAPLGDGRTIRVTNPPGVPGLGYPSGGTLTSRSVIRYDPGSPDSQTQVEVLSCTLPDARAAVCEAAITAFLARTGRG